jgi:hypothetical protein
MRSCSIAVSPSRLQSRILLPLCLLVGWVVSQELLNEVDVGHDHAAAAVTGESERVHGLAILCVSYGQMGVSKVYAHLSFMSSCSISLR